VADEFGDEIAAGDVMPNITADLISG
jgi:hypothetical protein